MIELGPTVLFHIGPFPFTNSFLNTLFIDALLIVASIYITKHISIIPGKFQNIMEMLIESFYDITKSVSQNQAHKIFPYFLTFFLFILIANLSGLLPVIKSIEYNHNPIFRAASTDLNVSLALAIVSVIATHAMSISTLGIKEYLSRFFSINPFLLFLGLLELFIEFAKIISFSFRLFGNIFAGEVMLGQLNGALSFVLPVPLILYEIGVGTLQAVIFGMLTMAFMAILMMPHKAEH